MTTIQLATLVGLLIAGGATLLLWQLAPAHPQLAAAIERLSPERSLALPIEQVEIGDQRSLSERAGMWTMRRAPWLLLGRTPTVDLELLQFPLHRFLAMKFEYAIFGLAMPVAIDVTLWLLGYDFSLALPFGASLLAAALLSLLPNLTIKDRAKRARMEFKWALIAYVELVAVERRAGSGGRQALEEAAQLSDAWSFRRIAEELGRTRWSGESPWEGLVKVGKRLDLPDLVDFAEVMRLSGDEGAAVYSTLRAKAASLRSEIINTNLGDATAQTQKMGMPIAGIFIVFATFVVLPVGLRLLSM